MFRIQNPVAESWQEDSETVIFGDDLLEIVDPPDADEYEAISGDDLLQEVEPSGVVRVAPRFSRPTYEGPVGRADGQGSGVYRPASAKPARHQSSVPPLPLPRVRAASRRPVAVPFFEQPTPEMHTRASLQTFLPQSRPPVSAGARAREEAAIPPPPPLPRDTSSPPPPPPGARVVRPDPARATSKRPESRSDTLRPYVRWTAPDRSVRPAAPRRAKGPSASNQFYAANVSWSGLLEAARQLARMATTGGLVALAGMVLGVASTSLLFQQPMAEEPGASASVEPFVLDADAIEPVAQPSFLERVRSGKKDAVQELEKRDPTSLSPDEVDALSEGREQLARRKTTEVVGAMVEKDGRLSAQDKREFLLHAGDASTYRQALGLMATRDTWQGPDLIYAAYERYRQEQHIADFARALLLTPRVYKYASPALTVVIDAETTTECDLARQLLERAYDDADNRAVPHLVKYAKTTGCGADGRDDCYSCLRDDRLLGDALRAAQGRRSPF